MKKVLWLSEDHPPVPSQIAELRKLFGEDVIVDVSFKTISSVSDILKAFKRNFYDEMVVVMPWGPIIKRLVDFGYKPLYAKMRQAEEWETPDIVINGRSLISDGFRRIEKIEVVYTDLVS